MRYRDDPDEPNEPLDLGFIHPRLTQQFYVRSRSMKRKGFIKMKEYGMELHNFTDPSVTIDKKHITVSPKFRVHTIWQVNGDLAKNVEIYVPDVTARLTYSRKFHVRDRNTKKTVRFVIKAGSIWCKPLGCPIVWEIHHVWRRNGVKKPVKRLRYYGVKDPETEYLMYYRSSEDYRNDKHHHNNWLAKVVRNVRKTDQEHYNVWVRPLEDAAVILLSVVCLDYMDKREMVKAARDSMRKESLRKESLRKESMRKAIPAPVK